MGWIVMKRISLWVMIGLMLVGCGLVEEAAVMSAEVITRNAGAQELLEHEGEMINPVSKDNDEPKGLSIASMQFVPGECYDIYVFIDSYDLEKKLLYFNVVEWVTTKERANEIGIRYPEDMQGGYYIYDEVNTVETLSLSSGFTYTMLNETTPMSVEPSALYEFIDYMNEDGFTYPFCLRVLNNEITKVSQVAIY